MNFQKSDPALASSDEPQILENRKRAQDRIRRRAFLRRETEARNLLKVEREAAKFPPEFRARWRRFALNNLATKKRASAEVQRTLPSIPESRRDEFLVSNRPHTKPSIAELRNRFIRQVDKRERGFAEVRDFLFDQNYEGGVGDPDDFVGRSPPPPEINDDFLLCKDGFVRPGWLVEERIRRIRGKCGGERLINRDLATWQRMGRAVFDSCRMHGGCVTSRPEYQMVSLARIGLRPPTYPSPHPKRPKLWWGQEDCLTIDPELRELPGWLLSQARQARICIEVSGCDVLPHPI